jgi:hypothetical protein
MCHMVSVTILPTGQGLELLAAPSLISHMDIVYRYGLSPSETVFEVEWVEGSGYPVIRTPFLFFFNGSLKEWLLSNYPTRERLISGAIKIANSPIPDNILMRNWRMRIEEQKDDDEDLFRIDYQRVWAMEAALREPVTEPVDTGNLFVKVGKVEVVE